MAWKMLFENNRFKVLMTVINIIFALIGIGGLVVMGFGFYYIVEVLRPVLQDWTRLIKLAIGLGLIIAGYVITYISALWLKMQKEGEHE